MIKSRLHVDLPSEEAEHSRGVGEWIRSLFGRKNDRGSSHEELTMDALALVEGIVNAFSSAGVTDVISMNIDDEMIYLDVDEVSDDLELMRQAAHDSGALERPFSKLHVAFSHREDGLHTLIDLEVRSEVVMGEDEMVVRLVGRVEDLRARLGETPATYADRIRRRVATPRSLEPYRVQLGELAVRLASALKAHLTGAAVKRKAPWIELVRPESDVVEQFEALPFGQLIRLTAYRPEPEGPNRRAYGDPYYAHYDDPYFALTTWLILDEMLRSPEPIGLCVVIVDAEGGFLGSGQQVDEALIGWVGSEGVELGDDGIKVDGSQLPQVLAAGPETGRFEYFDVEVGIGAEAEA